jgi:hypothetical protein
MQSFRDWAMAHGRVPQANAANNVIVIAVADYLKAIVEEAFFWSRTPANNLQNAVQLGLAATLAARPAALGPQPNAAAGAGALAAWQNARQLLINWGQQLPPAITQLVQNFQAQHANALQQEVTRLNTARRLADAAVAIPSPTQYFQGVNLDHGVEKKLLIGYIDFVVAAINDYVARAVPHSNEMRRRAENVVTQLGRCKGDAFTGADSTICEASIFNKMVPGAFGGEDIKDVAAYWSTERQATARRIQEVQAWAQIQGRGEDKATLRRYGSAGELADIRGRRGFYQAPGRSFERYKWFVDLTVPGGTTSVSDSDKSFWVHLKVGALVALNGIRREYVVDDQPAVTFKPNMGGEIGCFGVHEDVLTQFNRQLIGKVVLWNQKTNKEETPAVVTA